MLWERKTAASLHSFFSNLRIVIIKIVDHSLLNEVNDTHRKLSKIVVR
jgi:hypothetical protein